MNKVVTGSMGSTYYRIEVPVDQVPRLAEFDWNRLGRRVFIDPIKGVISWMAPSWAHETYSRASDKVVEGLANAAGRKVVLLGSTRWPGPGDPVNTGAEPDACFYIGATAEAHLAVLRKSDIEAQAFIAGHPPELVVEVERAHDDDSKPAHYHRMGVGEMWRIDVDLGRAPAVGILDLRPTPPRTIQTSRVLPLVRSELVAEALALARNVQDRKLQRLLAAYGNTVAAACND